MILSRLSFKNQKNFSYVHSAGFPPNGLRPFGEILVHSAACYVHSAACYVHSANDSRPFGAILVHSATETSIRRTTSIQRQTVISYGFMTCWLGPFSRNQERKPTSIINIKKTSKTYQETHTLILSTIGQPPSQPVSHPASQPANQPARALKNQAEVLQPRSPSPRQSSRNPSIRSQSP